MMIMMRMMMMMRRKRRNRRSRTSGSGLLQSTGLNEAASSGPSEKADHG
jgi:hypothetical protein